MTNQLLDLNSHTLAPHSDDIVIGNGIGGLVTGALLVTELGIPLKAECEALQLKMQNAKWESSE